MKFENCELDLDSIEMSIFKKNLSKWTSNSLTALLSIVYMTVKQQQKKLRLNSEMLLVRPAERFHEQ